MADELDPSVVSANPDTSAMPENPDTSVAPATQEPTEPAGPDYGVGTFDHTDPTQVIDWYQGQMTSALNNGDAQLPPQGPGENPPTGNKPPVIHTYNQSVEQYRQMAWDEMPDALKKRPDAGVLLDKFLHTMSFESGGGNESAMAPGSDGATGLMRIQNLPGRPTPQQLLDPKTNISFAWGLISKNPEVWTDYGEGGTTFNGKPFGALSQHPYGVNASIVQAVNVAQSIKTPTTPSGLPDVPPIPDLPENSILNPDLTPAELVFQAQSASLDAVNNVTDNPAVAEILSSVLRDVDPEMRKEALDAFKDGMERGIAPSDPSQNESFLEKAKDGSLFKQQGPAAGDIDENLKGDPQAAFLHMLDVMRDNMGNADPNVLQAATVASMIGPAFIGGLLEGGAAQALKSGGEAAASIVVGQGATKAVAPLPIPERAKAFISDMAGLTPFTVGAQGVTKGLLEAVGGAGASQGYQMAGGPDIVNIPGVGPLGPLAAQIAGSFGVAAIMGPKVYTPQEALITEAPRTVSDIANGRYLLTTADGNGTLEYHDTPEGASIVGLNADVGTDSQLLQRAILDIRSRRPDAIISTTVNSPDGVSMFSQSPEALFLDKDGNLVTPAEAMKAGAVNVRLDPSLVPTYDDVVTALTDVDHGVVPVSTASSVAPGYMENTTPTSPIEDRLNNMLGHNEASYALSRNGVNDVTLYREGGVYKVNYDGNTYALGRDKAYVAKYLEARGMEPFNSTSGPTSSTGTGYENTPDNLMGFSNDPGKQKGYSEQGYSYNQPVRVTFSDGTSIIDEVKGLNKPHALERASRNWEGATIEPLSAAEIRQSYYDAAANIGPSSSPHDLAEVTDLGNMLYRNSEGKEGIPPNLSFGTNNTNGAADTSFTASGAPPVTATTVRTAAGLKGIMTPFAPLRDLTDYIKEIKDGVVDSKVLQTLMNLPLFKINPSGAYEQAILQGIGGVLRMRLEARYQVEASMKALVDVYNNHVSGFDRLWDKPKSVIGIPDKDFQVQKNNWVTVPQSNGVKVDMNIYDFYDDAYKNPAKYQLINTQLQAITEAHRYVQNVNDERRIQGLPTYNFLEVGSSIPRQVVELGGIKTERPSSSKYTRTYELAEEGNRAGVIYSGIRDALSLFGQATYRDIIDKQLSDYLEPYKVKPTALIDPQVIQDLVRSNKNLNAAEADLAALRRNTIRLQTAGRDQTVLRSLRQTRFATMGDVQQAVSQLQDSVRLQLKITKDPQFRYQSLPNQEAALEALATSRTDLATMRDYQQKVQAGHVVLGQPIAGASLNLLAQERSTLLAQNRQLIDSALTQRDAYKADVARTKSKYTQARKDAEGEIRADAGLFKSSPKGPGELIGIDMWRGAFLPTEDAESLKMAFDTWAGTKDAGPVETIMKPFNTIANATRFLSLFMHFTAPLVHGLPTLGMNPKIWAEGSAAQVAATYDPVWQADFVRNHFSSIQEMLHYGIPMGGNDMFGGEEGVLPDAAAKLRTVPLPGTNFVADRFDNLARQGYGRSAGAYSTALLVYRTELWESLKNSPLYAQEPEALGQVIRNVTGGLDSSALGVGKSQRSIEAVWMAFSPRLLRSTAALLADAVRGMAGGALHVVGQGNGMTPAQRGSLTAVAGLTTAVIGLYTVFGLALGKSPEEIKDGFNPLDGKKFLSYKVGDNYFGIGSEVRSMLQFLSTSIYTGVTDPGAFIKHNQSNPLIRYWMERGSPGWTLGSKLVGAFTGSNPNPYDKTTSFRDLWVGQDGIPASALPFAAKEIIKDGQDGIFAAVATTVGIRSSVATASDQLTAVREEARTQFGDNPQALQDAAKALGYDLSDPNASTNLQSVFNHMTYQELLPGEQKLVDATVDKNHPDLKPAYEDARRLNASIYQTVADHADKVKVEFGKQYDALWKEMQEGLDPAEVKKRLDAIKNQEAGALGDVYGTRRGAILSNEAKEYQDAIANLQPNDGRKKEQEWFDIVTKNTAPDGISVDWDKVDEDRIKYMQGLQVDPAMQQRIVTDLGLSDKISAAKKPAIEQFQATVDNMLTPYYNISKDETLDNSQKQIAKETWMAQNPQANAMGWMMYGTGIQSVEAAQAALSFGIKRDKNAAGQDIALKFNGSKLEITPDNIGTFQRYSNEINRLLSDHGKIQIGRGTMTNIQLLREENPLYDALYFALAFQAPATEGIYKGTVPVYHNVAPYLQQMGLSRPDKAIPRPTAPTLR